MITVFARNNSIPSILIRLVTWSRWHHAGALTSDGKYVIEANFFHGVIKTPINDFLSRYTTTKMANIECDDTYAQTFLHDQLHKKYDKWAAIAIFLRIKTKPNNHWFCFELLAAASGLFRSSRISRITGSDLWAISKDL